MGTSKAEISIIIPAYNEVDSITNVINQIRADCASINYELIVVDDGSTDGTAELLEKTGVTVYTNQFNLGYGATIKIGVRNASNEIICITDADGTYPTKRIPDLFFALQECDADMVVGARPWNQIEFKRRLAKYIIHKFSELLLSRKVPDMNSGLRIFKKSVFEQFMRIYPNGFSITSTMTMAFSFYGHRIEFIPINYFHRVGKSKIHPIKDTLNFIQLILRTIVFFDPLKVFLPPSIFLIVGGFLLAITQIITIQNITSITAITLFSGMQLLATGLLADIINRKL